MVKWIVVMKIQPSICLDDWGKSRKTSVRLVGTKIWTRDLPNASLLRYHGTTSLGFNIIISTSYVFKVCLNTLRNYSYHGPLIGLYFKFKRLRILCKISGNCKDFKCRVNSKWRSKQNNIDRARWLRGNARDSHSGGRGFESRCRPTWLRFFRGFPQSSRQMLGWIFIITIHFTIIQQIHIGPIIK